MKKHAFEEEVKFSESGEAWLMCWDRQTNTFSVCFDVDYFKSASIHKDADTLHLQKYLAEIIQTGDLA